MGVYTYIYIGAYFEMPEEKVEIAKETIMVCPECKSKHSKDARFCSACGVILKEKQVKTKVEISLWDICDDSDMFTQPEYGRTVIANYSSKYNVSEEANDCISCEYDEDKRLNSIAEFEIAAKDIFQWFDDNMTDRPVVKYGTVIYMC